MSRTSSLFANRIRKARRDLDMTQEDLAKRSGLGRNTVYRYEAGTHEPYLDEAVRIADALGVSLDWLSGRSNIKEEGNEKRKF